jgi:hypothetical protein
MVDLEVRFKVKAQARDEYPFSAQAALVGQLERRVATAGTACAVISGEASARRREK